MTAGRRVPAHGHHFPNGYRESFVDLGGLQHVGDGSGAISARHHIRCVPDDGSIRPAIAFNRVDFPEPLGPINAVMPPTGISNLELSRAIFGP